MKVHKVTAILRANGFEAGKSEWVKDGNRRFKVQTPGYNASQHGSLVGIECSKCLDKLNDIIATLTESGFKAEEVIPGGGFIKVS